MAFSNAVGGPALNNVFRAQAFTLRLIYLIFSHFMNQQIKKIFLQ